MFRSKQFKAILPFSVFIGTGFAYLSYTSRTRYEIKLERDSEAQLEYLTSDLKVAPAPTLEEVYKEIEGKTFDNWTSIRGPHIGEDNSAYEKIVQEQKRAQQERREQLRKQRKEAYLLKIDKKEKPTT